ncbi:DNA polymerase III subunit beta [Sporomusa sp.]|uniref:DNA polymerase III subunit beta n=1 Tax=Sporomusa sp. TaxID=2078658 RepID=UPI002C238FD8|nr:DNA polymerase III subunit beta [Sporomusa sp.]HWR06162.1 DNA polymerase III subunit beta [Sporomusa sp.]
MEIRFNSKDLEKAVQAVNKIISGRLPNPTLSGILIVANDGKVQFTATNYETTIRYTVEADIRDPGRVLVSGKLFHELIKRMPGKEIAVSTNNKKNMLSVLSGRAVYDILTMNVFEYPEFDIKDVQNPVYIKASMLHEIQRKVAFAAMETELTSPVFSGVYLHLKDGLMSAIASDKKRLARLTFALEGEGEVILPPKSLAEITSLVDGEDDITAFWDKGKVIFLTDSIRYESRIITGTFPDVERVIPKNPIVTVTMERTELLQAIERLSLIGLERQKDFTLNNVYITMESDLIYIKSNKADKGAAREEIQAIIVGEPVEICFHGTQIIDCLKALDNDKVVLSMTGPRAASTIVGEADDSYIYVISPISTGQAQAAAS